MGIWYEYSAYPNTFELGQECVYANYSIVDSSTVSVVNGGISGLWVRKKLHLNNDLYLYPTTAVVNQQTHLQLLRFLDLVSWQWLFTKAVSNYKL